jgi:hypothetical protein
MHPLISAMLAVNVAVMQVVNVVGVQHRFVSTPWTVGVTVMLGLCVLHSRHGASLSSDPSHAYMRRCECQDAIRQLQMPRSGYRS